MNAQELTKALGGRWSGSAGVARCPSHEDRTPSLSIRDGDDGKLLTHCHAGCAPEVVWSALQDQSHVEQHRDRPAVRRRNSRLSRRRDNSKLSQTCNSTERERNVLELWRAAQPAPGTPAEIYLRHRGITISVPPTLRYHLGLKHAPTGQNLPAMVAAITGSDRKVTAVQRTFLRVDGGGKANVSQSKMSLGSIGDGAVRLGPAGPVLGIAEGIETGLSAAQIFELPVWGSLSASRLDRLWLPAEAMEVHLFADNGVAGHEAAERAAAAYQAQGRRVVVRFPPEQFGDWNDVLRAEAAA